MMAFCKPLQCATMRNSNFIPRKRALPYLENTYQSLSADEQERVDRDVCGMEEPINESPPFIDSKRKELLEELDHIDDKSKNAYNQAVLKSIQTSGDGANNYINSAKFHLMFLRAERFEVKMAAKRMVRYFKEKLELFGSEKLDCKIKQEDLNEQDIAALYGGAFSITGATDEAGRLILFVRRQQLSCVPVTNLKRAVFYLIQSAVIDSEEVQRSGFVAVNHNIRPPGPQKLRDTSQVRKLFPLFKMCVCALPFKVAAIHECYNDLSYHFYLGLALMVVPNLLLPRIICHYGTNIDCLCDLLAYGIGVDNLPITLEGDFQRDLLHNYLYWRRSVEGKNNCVENHIN